MTNTNDKPEVLALRAIANMKIDATTDHKQMTAMMIAMARITLDQIAA